MTSFTERRQRVKDGDGTLHFLEISAETMPEVLRLVNDNVNWTSKGLEYIGYPFEFKPPDDQQGQASQAKLIIGNAGRSLTEDLEALTPGTMMIAKVMLSDRADPNHHERTYYLPIQHVTVTPTQVEAKLGRGHIMRQASVNLIFDEFLSPGNF